MGKNEEQYILSLLKSPQEKAKGLELLVAQFSEQLYWKIRTIVLTHEDANDVLQNTFLKVWKSLDDFRGESALSTWMYRIAINESLDFLRHRHQADTVSADFESSVANRLLADEYFDGSRAQALLQEAIAKLPDVQRTVFTLRYYDEMPYAEMSKLLQTSEGGLKASYHIAVKKITEYVKTHSFDGAGGA